MAARRAAVPHHGLVSAGCPVECLLAVLSVASFNPLARAYDAPFDPPRTVCDVVDLYDRRMLRQIRGLGPRKISEIEAALVFAGLDITGHQQAPGHKERPAT